MDCYRERVAWPGWFYLILALAFGIGISGTAALLWREGSNPPNLVGLGALVVVGVVFWRLRWVALEFRRDGVAFGFGGLHRRVPADRIVKVSVERYPVARYMGWGYRLGWERRERAYSVIGCRRGVRLVFDDERGRRWSVFLSSREPERALEALGKDSLLSASIA